MSELRHIIYELKKIHSGEAWHGPALLEMLGSITAEQAAARPVKNGHSIWELVLHIGGWEEACLQRLQGKPTPVPEDGDFPPVSASTPEAWRQTLDRLESAHHRLIEAAEALTDSDIDRKLTGYDYSVGFLLRGLILHHVYHSGQIRLLQKSFG
ncbi:MAG TPA: DinB family protein [Blastocatellia bacterium]|nr:DinB family protein [Blastocatellia bacterium]